MNFKTASSLPPALLDPHKRINYSLGLVLGVDEFWQEQRYLIEGDRLHNRLLHGYGTVAGLHVLRREDSDIANGSLDEVLVEPGCAIDPQGQAIYVPSRRCASVNDWLGQAENRKTVVPEDGPVPASVTLYVVLCYRECLTDAVPIPGSPCRTETDSTRPSRIEDSFELKLVAKRPLPPDEKLVACFGRLLNRLEIDATAAEFISAEALAAEVRALPNCDPAAPPDAPLFLHPDDACAVLDHAMHVWVTEVRPCHWQVDGQPCVPLAQVAVPLHEVGGQMQVDGAITVDDEKERPILLHTRLLQEWLTCGRTGGTTQEPLALDDLTDVTAVPTDEGHTLVRRGGEWVSEKLSHSDLGDLNSDDHPQYLTEGDGDARYARLDHSHAAVTDHDHPQYLIEEDGDVRYARLDHLHETVTNHDHPQYLTEARGNTLYAPRSHTHALENLSNVEASNPGDTQVLTWIAGNNRWEPRDSQGGSSIVAVSQRTKLQTPLARIETTYSDAIQLPFRTTMPPPISLAVRDLQWANGQVTDRVPRANEPSAEIPNVALTTYLVDTPTGPGFRIAATNLSAMTITTLVVQWTIVQV